MLGLSICSFISTLLVGPFFDILGRRKMLLFTCKIILILDGITGILLPFSNLIKNNSTSL
jgi:MFS family permease